MGTPFTGFDGCTITQKSNITRAWWDVVELSRVPASQVFSPAGQLEQRIWGEDIANRDDAIDLIHSENAPPQSPSSLTSLEYPITNYGRTAVFGNIMGLYTSKTTGKIRISCEDLPQPHRTENEQVYCKKDVITTNSPIGGYAFSTGPSYEEGTIVLCSPFFAPGQEHLGAILSHLRVHPGEQRDPTGMTGKAHMLLHELTHLSAVEGQSEGE